MRHYSVNLTAREAAAYASGQGPTLLVRVCKMQPIVSNTNPPRNPEIGQLYICPDRFPTTDRTGLVFGYCESLGVTHCMGQEEFAKRFSPFGAPGTVLAGREAFRIWESQPYCCDPIDLEPLRFIPHPERETDQRLREGDIASYRLRTQYRADRDDADDTWGWRPAQHMPRWAVRRHLEVVSVTCKPVQEITTSEIEASGIVYEPEQRYGGKAAEALRSRAVDCKKNHLRHLFGCDWNATHKPGRRWDDNPWCWFIMVERIEKGAE